MPDFTKFDNTVLDRVLNELNEKMVSVGYVTEQHTFGKEEPSGDVDIRDFKPMSLLIEEPTTGTPEENRAAWTAQVHEMEAAFESGDPARRKPYLDRMYEFRDTFDAEAIDPTNEEDLKKLLTYTALNQTYGSKAKENPEYIRQHYPDAQAKKDVDILDRYSVAVAQNVMDVLQAQGKGLSTQLTLPASGRGYESYAETFYDFAKADYDRVQDARAGREQESVTQVKLPAEYGQFNRFVKMDDRTFGTILDSRAPQASQLKMSMFLSNIGAFNGVFLPQTTQGDVLKTDITKGQYDMMFIDGKSVTEIQKERFPQLDPMNSGDACAFIMAQAVLSGKHRIDIAQMEKNDQGEFEVKVNPVRFDLSDVQPPLKEDYSWFRRTFFNWGPLRCKTRQEKADALLANDPDREARIASIQEKVKENVIEPCERKRIQDEARRERERMTVRELAGPSKEQTLEKTKVVEKTKTKTMEMGAGGM